jgi:VanZ family protein
MTQATENQASTGRRLELAKLWYSLAALMLLVVAAASLLPAPDVGVSDKLSHVITYLVLAGWFSLLATNRVALCWTAIGLLAYGMLMELLQGTTGYRYAEWGDVLANGAGVVAGSLFYFSPLPRLLRFVDSRMAPVLLR